jgi:hypothetical protein
MFGKGDHKIRIYILFVVIAIAPVAGYGQAKEPLLLNLGSFQSSGSYIVSTKYTVPAGKRLVIEQIFVEVTVPTGGRARGSVRVETVYTYGSSAQYLPFQFTSQGTISDETVYSSSQPMKIYVTNPANSGYTKKVCFYVTGHGGTYISGDWASISGYLEDAV